MLNKIVSIMLAGLCATTPKALDKISHGNVILPQNEETITENIADLKRCLLDIKELPLNYKISFISPEIYTAYEEENSLMSINSSAISPAPISDIPKSPNISSDIPSQYKSYIDQLKEKHPNWTFYFYDTGLSWDTVMAGESSPNRNVIAASQSKSMRVESEKSEGNTVAEKIKVEHEGYVPLERLRKDNDDNTVIYSSDGKPISLLEEPSSKSKVKETVNNAQKVKLLESIQNKEDNDNIWCHIKYTTEKTVESSKNKRWYQANAQTIAHYLDVRNFLNEADIFQFERLSYSNKCDLKDIEKILSNTYMSSDISIENLDGEETTYAQAFLDAAVKYNVNPFHLISRAFQETGQYGSAATKGKDKKYPSIYNFYNIGAYAEYTDGLRWASKDNGYMTPWDTPFKAILGGAHFISEGYINNEQDTLYFQKFDVTHGSGSFGHQYMSFVGAASSEAGYIYNFYKENNVLSNNLSFIIPVYEGIPDEVVALP